MRKFAKGTFELDLNVTNLEEYEKSRKDFLEGVVSWADKIEMAILFGTSDDGTYLCEFDVKANTKKLCDGYVAELKSMLKSKFPKIRLLYQANGNYLY